MRFDSPGGPGRILIAAGVIAATVAVVAIWGLGFTSGLIELLVFVAGLVGWALVRRSDTGSEAHVRGVRSKAGSVKVRQRADSTSATRISARGDVKIRQEDGRKD
jgi:hypothetical protein